MDVPDLSRLSLDFFQPKIAGKNRGKFGIGRPDLSQILGRVGIGDPIHPDISG